MTLDVFETVGVSFLQIQVLFVFKDDCRFFVLDFITYAFQGAFIIKKVVTDIFNMLPDVLKLSVFGKNRILIGDVRLTAKINGNERRWISKTVVSFRKADGKWVVTGWQN